MDIFHLGILYQDEKLSHCLLLKATLSALRCLKLFLGLIVSLTMLLYFEVTGKLETILYSGYILTCSLEIPISR